MDAGLFIAFRYLFAKKSHNVINVISAISAAGIAVGTAALILILSVYNGFDGIIRANLSDLSPDLLVRSEGASLFPAETANTIHMLQTSWANHVINNSLMPKTSYN